jgi:hypothetical protein
MRQYWVAPLPPFHIADQSNASFTTLQDCSPLPAITLPANILELGSELDIQVMGNFSTTGTPTFTFGVYYGGVAGVALGATSAITTGSGAASWPWWLHYRGIVRAIGTSGSINGQGWLMMGTSLTAATFRPLAETLGARTVTIDTTAAKTITFGSACGTSSASNIMLVNDISVKLVT